MRDADLARFMSKVDRTEGQNGCWIWRAARSSTGYGGFWLDGRMYAAHRLSCEHFNGLAADRIAIHSCDNKACVNPAHLRWGTYKDNSGDARLRGKTASGDRQGLRKHPERASRGEKHRLVTLASLAEARRFQREHPECLARGEENGNARLTWSAVQQIRAARINGARLDDIARDFGVSRATVYQVTSRKTWRVAPSGGQSSPSPPR